MVEKYNIRTDLALEEKERFESDHVEVQGVILTEEYDEENEIRITTVRIETENGAKVMGKPVGSYITIEAPEMAVPDEGYHEEISQQLRKFIGELLPKRKMEKILVVGLGNRQVTPDALGPYVVDNLHITRHIIEEYGKYATGEDEVWSVSAIVPGVMGQTGMETVEVIRGVVAETKPDILLVIDALAARNSKRLNRTIQISDAGIHPGSGVGNHRQALTKETLGVPVIAVGIPMVVYASTIVRDALKDILAQGSTEEAAEAMAERLSKGALREMVVTPRSIDELVAHLADTLALAINIALQPSFTARELSFRLH